MTTLDVTVIVPTYNRLAVLENTLSTIPHPKRLTIVVVKRGSRNRDCPKKLGDYKIVETDPAGAYVKAVQDGIEHAKTKLVLVSNDDCEMEPDTIGCATAAYYHLFGYGDGVIGLNHGDKWRHLACMALMSKKFYMEQCWPMPYHHYCADNEWTTKAVSMGCYGRCLKAVVHHEFGEHVEPWHTNDWKLFPERMANWRLKYGCIA
jgi:GT2 family glycosyltransferase